MRHPIPAALLAALMSTASALHAQPTAGNEANEKLATELFDEGTKLYRKSKWAEAEAKFQASWELVKAPDTAANLGDCELHIGQPREAAEHLSFALKTLPMTTDDTLRKRVRTRLEEAKRQVASVVISVTPAGAAVTVDDRALGTAPLQSDLFVDPGSHRFSATLVGYRTAESTVEAPKGETVRVALTLEPQPSPASPAPTPKATAMPIAPAGPGAGPNGYLIAAGIVGTVALAATAVGFVVASGARGDRREEQLDAIGGDTQCRADSTFKPGSPECESIRDASADERTFMGLGMAAFIGSGVVLGGTLTYALWPRPKRSTSGRARIVPRFGSGFLGVEGAGSF